MMILGLLLAAIPFAFAVIRAAGTGTDLRYLCVALAAAVASWSVLRFSGHGNSPTAASVAVALGTATTAASVTAFVQGAQSVPAVLFVALGFAICEVGGLALVRRARAG